MDFAIASLRPDSIFQVVPEEIFIEKGWPQHQYITSGRCYEIKYAIAKYVQPRSILEIGVRFGYSLAALIMGSDRVEYAEGWDNCSYVPDSNAIAEKNLRKLPKSIYPKLHQKDCADASELLRSFDLVHIDGPHLYEKTLHALNLCKTVPVRAVVVDDFNNCPDDVRACRDFVAANKDLVLDAFEIDSYRGDFLILLKTPPSQFPA